MENVITPEIMAIIVPSVLAGIGFLGKYVLNKRDEAQKRVFEQRDKDKEDIKNRIVKLEKKATRFENQLHNVMGMIIKCEDPECPTKKILANYWEKENGNENEDSKN